MNVAITEYKPNPRSGENLRALVSVRLNWPRTNTVIDVHHIRVVHEKNKRPFCQMPLKTWWKDGKQMFGGPVIVLPAEWFCKVQRVIMVRYAEETGQSWN